MRANTKTAWTLLWAAGGLALPGVGMGAALAQGGPLGETFPAALELNDLDGQAGFRLDGVSPGDGCGISVAWAGDVNGDGLDDLVVGALTADPDGRPAAGSTYVVFGRPADSPFPPVVELAALDGSLGFRIDGVDAQESTGAVVAPAGDVNGDGVGDLIIGHYKFTFGGPEVGVTYVVFGRGAGSAFPAVLDLATLDGSNGFRIESATPGDRSGIAVAAAGDFNGDGIGDVIIGAPRTDAAGRHESGAAFIVFGRPAGSSSPSALNLADLDATTGVRLDGFASNDRAGDSVAPAGDVNGDGVDDVIVGAPRHPGASGHGSAFVVFGRADGTLPAVLSLADLDGATGFRLDGGRGTYDTGDAVSSAGDINGDGVDDILVGSFRARPGGVPNVGTTFVVYGRATEGAFPAVIDLTSMPISTGFRIDGVAGGDFSGRAVAAASDVNNDGVDDLLIGAPSVNADGAESAGAAYVVFGRRSCAPFPSVLSLGELNGRDGFKVAGGRFFGGAGRSVAPAGDMNHDGIADIIIGEPSSDSRGSDRPGSAFVVYGRDAACVADLDRDGRLDVFDYLVFQGFFAQGCIEADFDGDGALTIFDFLVFQTAFDAGCR